ncbi:DNA/RNA helicase domain-containing protein [Coraliomargarita sp. W4R53]
MIIYLEKKSTFRADVFANRIEDKVRDTLKAKAGKSVSESEINSWKNSLRYMDVIVEDPEIPEDTGIAIEFNVPNTSKRIDFILTGKSANGTRTAVIVELKQWSNATVTSKDAIVNTYLGGGQRDTNHPSYQAWSYATLIEDYNETVRNEPIQLQPCAYLHNCESGSAIQDPRYREHTDRAPAFLKHDSQKLRDFIKTHVKYGDSGEAMYLIRDGKIRPSKNLADHLCSLLKGKPEFCLIDDQKVVYETAKLLAEISTPAKKNVLIVNGGPGTGKTVVAINLLVELTKRELVAQYVTKNSAPREVYQSKLSGTFTKTRISNLFKGSGAYTETPANTFQALIVDEAHRLNEKSGMFSNLGENQVKEIINASTFSIFFLDEAQRVHWKDIGDNDQVKHWAEEAGASITELSLQSQFRCNGSDGYLGWIDYILGIRDTANTTLEGINYEFKVCSSATELRNLILERNRPNNKARMVAGYTAKWVSKKDPAAYDFDYPEENFKARWNLTQDGMLWILKESSVHEIGCIHTCQGLEVDYIGVIFGDDFLIRDGAIVTDAGKRYHGDRSISGYKKALKANRAEALQRADEIIKNTYRTLMTRGQKGCYVYSRDPETNAYLQQVAQGALEPTFEESVEQETLPFRILEPEDVQPYHNALPCFDIKVAAGAFSAEQWIEDCQWIEPPEHIAIREGYFVAQVIGESMNQRIPNGAWCLFKANPVGSREGKIVLVQHRDIQDPAYSGSFTIKVYTSEKVATDEGWQHQRIVLQPRSNQPEFDPIYFDPSTAQDLQVIGEFVTTL